VRPAFQPAVINWNFGWAWGPPIKYYPVVAAAATVEVAPKPAVEATEVEDEGIDAKREINNVAAFNAGFGFGIQKTKTIGIF